MDEKGHSAPGRQVRVSAHINCTTEKAREDGPPMNQCNNDPYKMGIIVNSTINATISDKAALLEIVRDAADPATANRVNLNRILVIPFTNTHDTAENGTTGYWIFVPELQCFNGVLEDCKGDDEDWDGEAVVACGYKMLSRGANASDLPSFSFVILNNKHSRDGFARRPISNVFSSRNMSEACHTARREIPDDSGEMTYFVSTHFMNSEPQRDRKVFADMESKGTQQPLLVAPEWGLVKRFYPPLLFLIGLTSMCPRRRLGEDPEFDALTGLEPLFRAFASKIAFLCCTEVGGGAISACAVLQLPDCIQDVIGFNQKSSTRREKIQDSIGSILHLFSAVPPEHSAERETLRNKALHASLELCKSRVNGYLKSLRVHLQECIEACERENAQESHSTQDEMSQILRLLEACFDTCHSEPGVGRLAREDNMMSTTHWSDFVHVAGRLLTYKRAVDLMDLVAKIWPQLFSNIQICMIPSSSTVPGVLPINPWTAAEIMSKMTSDESLLGRFAAQLGSLSVHDIDAKVAELWRRAPKPLVHAEVLVHDWLENTEGGIRPERFFNRWKFIGSSKPPCKLCSYFFDEYPTDVQVRPSHQNAYFAWRMPDVYDYQGEESSRKRMLVMDSIKARIRADVMRILSEKLADGRTHDSSAYISLWRGIAPGPPNDPIPLEATTQLLESHTLSTKHEQGSADRKPANEVVKGLDEDEEGLDEN
ncbi:hypothetical protein FBULB1_13177 [Fusarium bulbicola]|nr:hypothetical protein FBULB1_13177 [Fusarium bulbicola]